MKHELDESLSKMFKAMVLNRALKELDEKELTEKHKEHLDQVELIALMAMTTTGREFDIKKQEHELKKYVSGYLFDFREKLNKHQDMLERKRNER